MRNAGGGAHDLNEAPTAGDGSFCRLTSTSSQCCVERSESGRYAMSGMLMVSREAGTEASPIPAAAKGNTVKVFWRVVQNPRLLSQELSE